MAEKEEKEEEEMQASRQIDRQECIHGGLEATHTRGAEVVRVRGQNTGHHSLPLLCPRQHSRSPSRSLVHRPNQGRSSDTIAAGGALNTAPVIREERPDRARRGRG
eukprot:GHVU01030322.1.p2 GENE.GHVU01030322.1~~GHVU01030322.1.p2  ORF type:complete len:106 (-),score=16.85 GHVU01030322.1:165-482(-)